MKSSRIQLGLIATIIVVQAVSTGRPVCGQEIAHSTNSKLRSGWQYRLKGGDERAVYGIAATPEWTPAGNSLDPRIESGPYQLQWSGLISGGGKGDYQFACYVQGRVRLKVNSTTLINGVANEPIWLRSEVFDLRSDRNEVECSWESLQNRGQFALFWRGPSFDWERLPANRLFHEATHDSGNDTSHAIWETGRTLVDTLRCAACHQDALVMAPLAAPELTHIGSSVRFEWIYQRLVGNDDQPPGNGHRAMPEYNLTKEEAAALISFLIHSSTAPEPSDRKPAEHQAEESKQQGASRLQGRELVVSLGCLACHEYDHLGHQGPYSGGDLSHIADKRPSDFFRRWLKSPASVNRLHRMPRFELSDEEIESISNFFETCRTLDTADDARPHGEFKYNPELIELGRNLYEDLRCANCHEPDRDLESVPLKDIDRFATTCGGNPDNGKRSPGYRLSDAQQLQVLSFLRDRPLIKDEDVEIQLSRNNCTSCHKRNDSLGISEYTDDVFERFPSLAGEASAFQPPSLNLVGDKLYRKAMTEMIRQGGNPRRPWLKVRMPKYRLSNDEIDELVTQLIYRDRMPEGLSPLHETLPPDAIAVAGPRLITTTGFGCNSCHQIGTVQPPPGPLNARGPSLTMIGQQVREDWFRRWVANPARFESGMEMPSIRISVEGVLNGDLDRQLTAVWQTLNRPGFEPPLPDPVRIVRHSGLKDTDQAYLLTDVVRTSQETFIKPFVIGLNHRHNLLLDLKSFRLAHWWAGDVMRQHTEGKTWFWEPGGTTLWRRTDDRSDWVLVRNGKPITPMKQGQFVTELESWKHAGNAVQFEYQLLFDAMPNGSHSTDQRVLRFAETYRPHIDRDSRRSGWQRQVRVEGLKADESLRFIGLIQDDSDSLSQARVNEARTLVELPHPEPVRFEIKMPVLAKFDESLGIDLGGADSNGLLQFSLLATTGAEIDTVHLPPLIRRTKKRMPCDLVPGFEGWVLPVGADWMPTALAWDPQGSLYVASLKGRVWRVSDRDDDGWEDDAEVFGDELAAPFGLSAHESGVDVINKFALLRISDGDGDGRADKTQRLASGWGHTADYHDWSVGLPRDDAGNYYIATSCQQDERTDSAAKWRGKVLKLIPRSNGKFAVEEISAGHRFPIGIAMRQDGELFVTDNQGNYNPFNELNHVVAGSRYGFINRLEREDLSEFKIRSPAINIPHPWTRSVNGICFLDGDAGGRATSDRRFGPFTGHVVGCEYDTRRLVRMSLQEVDGQFQGAIYPFSLRNKNEDRSLLGPVACAVSPAGELYIGNIRDSGWGGANNIGGIVRLRYVPDALPCGIAEVLATPEGFRIVFTRPASHQKASDKARYRVNSYRRVSTPQYGGPDIDRRIESNFDLSVNSQATEVELRFRELRVGFVYEFYLESMSEESEIFFPAEAHYTLNRIPALNLEEN